MLYPILTYGLASIVLRQRDLNRITAQLNTVRRMSLGINNRRDIKLEELKTRLHLSNISRKLQQRRLNQWHAINQKNDNVTL
jgi:hypothetical protein